jgi:hypothetical protein
MAPLAMNKPQMKEVSSHRSILKGYLYTVVVVLINLVSLVTTQLISSSSAVPQYTMNFVNSMVGLCVCTPLAMSQGTTSLARRSEVVACLKFGIASWFFQWGYTRCLINLNPLQYTALNVGVGPIVSVIFGFVLLGEKVALYKFSVMMRNILVVCLVLNIVEIIRNSAALASGMLWAVIAFCGTSGMRIVQRTSMEMAPAKLAFWGYVVNVFLWFPPGCLPYMRVPILWPPSPADEQRIFEVPAMTWAALAMSGVFGASIMIVQGLVLQHLDVGTYSISLAPMILVSTTIYEAFHHLPGITTYFGIALASVGFAADLYMEGEQKDQTKDEPSNKVTSSTEMDQYSENLWVFENPEMGA